MLAVRQTLLQETLNTNYLYHFIRLSRFALFLFLLPDLIRRKLRAFIINVDPLISNRLR